MTRRTFIAAPSMLAAAPASGDWFDRPMRWAQLAFVEDDPVRYDPQFWLDYLRRIHADTACLSAGGCVAFYPTKIRYHHRSTCALGPYNFEFMTVWRQENSVTVHLVNLTNPMMMKGPYREVVPLGPQRVRIRGIQPKSAKLLVSGVGARIDGAGILVPSIAARSGGRRSVGLLKKCRLQAEACPTYGASR